MVVTLGGTIPSDDVKELKELGVAEVFTPGASTQQAVDFIRSAGPDGRGAVRAGHVKTAGLYRPVATD